MSNVFPSGDFPQKVFTLSWPTWTNYTSWTGSDSTISSVPDGTSWKTFGFLKPQEELEVLTKTYREWAENFAQKSQRFKGAIKGLSAIVARLMFKSLRSELGDSQVKFGYTSSQHVFLTYTQKGLYGDETYYLDAFADLFGEPTPTLVIKSDLVNLSARPWLEAKAWYSSESGLIARQRKDKWPEFQITLPIAKSKEGLEIKFIEQGHTDPKNNLLRCQPFDKSAIKYLEGHAGGNGLKTNLASLLLDADPNVAEAALKIAKILEQR